MDLFWLYILEGILKEGLVHSEFDCSLSRSFVEIGTALGGEFAKDGKVRVFPLMCVFFG